MKKLTHALLAMMFIVVAVARAADDKPVESPYYPLKVGNTWTYKAGDIKISMKVAKFEEIDKQMCARLETSTGDKVVAVESVAVKEDGIYRYGYADQKTDPPLLFAKLPAAKDQTWDVNSTIGGQKVTGTFKSGMVDELTVAAGTYKDVYTCTGDCDAAGVKLKFTYFFAKDVGMIKQIVNANGQDIILELEKFEAGK